MTGSADVDLVLMAVLFGMGIAFLVFFFVIPRGKVERRAREILSRMAYREEKVEYLRFDSARPTQRKRAMESFIALMSRDDWVYLKASEANQLKALTSWGGGLNLHFVRETPGPHPCGALDRVDVSP